MYSRDHVTERESVLPLEQVVDVRTDLQALRHIGFAIHSLDVDAACPYPESFVEAKAQVERHHLLGRHGIEALSMQSGAKAATLGVTEPGGILGP